MNVLSPNRSNCRFELPSRGRTRLEKSLWENEGKRIEFYDPFCILNGCDRYQVGNGPVRLVGCNFDANDVREFRTTRELGEALDRQFGLGEFQEVGLNLNRSDCPVNDGTHATQTLPFFVTNVHVPLSPNDSDPIDLSYGVKSSVGGNAIYRLYDYQIPKPSTEIRAVDFTFPSMIYSSKGDGEPLVEPTSVIDEAYAYSPAIGNINLTLVRFDPE